MSELKKLLQETIREVLQEQGEPAEHSIRRLTPEEKAAAIEDAKRKRTFIGIEDQVHFQQKQLERFKRTYPQFEDMSLEAFMYGAEGETPEEYKERNRLKNDANQIDFAMRPGGTERGREVAAYLQKTFLDPSRYSGDAMAGATGPRRAGQERHWNTSQTFSRKHYDAMMPQEEVKAEVDAEETAQLLAWAEMDTRYPIKPGPSPAPAPTPPPPPKKKGRWETEWIHGGFIDPLEGERHSEPRKGLKGFFLGKGQPHQKWVEDEEGYYQGSEEDMAARKLRQTLREIVRQVISENNE